MRHKTGICREAIHYSVPLLNTPHSKKASPRIALERVMTTHALGAMFLIGRELDREVIRTTITTHESGFVLLFHTANHLTDKECLPMLT